MRIILILVLLEITNSVCAKELCKDDSTSFKEEIHYYDRNNDRKVDFESHIFPCLADANWELRDDNYDGRYEVKFVYGIGLYSVEVDIQIPEGVEIDTKQGI